MKNKIILMLIALSALFVGCTTNEYEAPGDISAVGFYTSTGTDAEINTALFGYTTFSDLSQGVIDHSWTIDEGNFFLKGPISFKENSKDFETKIINPGSTVTNDKTAIIYFKKAGNQKVRLYNTFDKFVNFRGSRYSEADGKDVEYDFPAKQIGDKWVIDTTFVVKVFDTLTPEVIVRKDGVVIDHMTSTPIEIEAGESLNFEDISTLGEPTNRYWFVRAKGTKVDINNSNDLRTDLAFNKLGNFVAGITISRIGENIPFGNKTKIFKLPIKVIPSSKPFTLVSVKEAEDQTIKVEYAGEFDTFESNALDFKVLVNGVDATISSVTLNSSNSTIIDIKLLDVIYNNDVIKVSLLDPKDVKSVDTRTPVTFTDEIVKMFDKNAALFNFDTATSLNWSAITSPDANSTISTSLSTTIFNSATQSFKLENENFEGGKWSGFENTTDTFVLEKGIKYKIEYKFYKTAGSTINMNGPFIANLEGQGNFQFWNNVVASAPVDTWVTVKPNQVLIPNNRSENATFFLRHNGTGTIYFDDLRIYEVDER